jgi:hypothetical protein
VLLLADKHLQYKTHMQSSVLAETSIAMASLLDCIPPSTDTDVLAASADVDGIILLGAVEKELLQR